MTKNKLRIYLKALARVMLAPVAWPVLAWRKLDRRTGAFLVALHLFTFLTMWAVHAGQGFPLLGAAFSYFGLVISLAITSLTPGMQKIVAFLEGP